VVFIRRRPERFSRRSCTKPSSSGRGARNRFRLALLAAVPKALDIHLAAHCLGMCQRIVTAYRYGENMPPSHGSSRVLSGSRLCEEIYEAMAPPLSASDAEAFLLSGNVNVIGMRCDEEKREAWSCP